MALFSYSPPVAKLLTLGEPSDYIQLGAWSYSTLDPAIIPWQLWIDYGETVGLTPAHIPELITLMKDEILWNLWFAEDIEAECAALDFTKDEDWWDRALYGPIHAWRALGQLKALEVLPDLLEIWAHKDSEWCWEDIPIAIARMGPDAIAPLQAQMQRPDLAWEAKTLIADTLPLIGRHFTDSRDHCVATLITLLEPYTENHPNVNGFLCSGLVTLKAVEALDLMEQVYASNCVESRCAGTWATVQVELGVKSKADFSPEDFEVPPLPDFEDLLDILGQDELSAFEAGLPLDVDYLSTLENPSHFGQLAPTTDLPPVKGFGSGSTPPSSGTGESRSGKSGSKGKKSAKKKKKKR